MTGDDHFRPFEPSGGLGQSPVDVLPPADPPVPPPAPSQYGPVKRTWWVLPYFGGLMAVIVVVAAVTAVLHTPRMSNRAADSSGTSSSATGPALMPAQMFPDALFRQLTGYVQAANKTGFLHLASAAARPAMQTWWDNLKAIGFTTGAVVPTASHDMVRVDRHGNGTAVVLAGVHSPLDPSDNKGKPDVPLTRYRIGLHFARPGATGQITSWQSLDHAPWDTGTLYVRKGPHVVVAGPASESAVVDQTVPVAEAAADYDIGLVNHVNFQDLDGQQGFVVFVSGSAAARNGWLTPVKQPSAWPPRFLSAQVFQLPGPGTTQVDATDAGSISDGSTGGARVVVGPYQQNANGGTPHSQTVTLVRDFMLSILAAHNQALANGLAAIRVPSWPQQGFAVAVQILFEANNNPAPGRYDFHLLTGDVHDLPASYKTGALPTGWKQLYGQPLAAAENWNEVAASVYAYIEAKYGMQQMFASAMLLYTRYAKPFGNILGPGSDVAAGTYVFRTSASVKAAWKAWLTGL
jgi:hypothetical protein